MAAAALGSDQIDFFIYLKSSFNWKKNNTGDLDAKMYFVILNNNNNEDNTNILSF